GRVAVRTAELEAANAALDQERTKLTVLVEQMPAAVFVVDASGRLERLNAQAEELLESAGIDPRAIQEYMELEVLRLDGSAFGPGQRPVQRALGRGEPTVAEKVSVRLGDGTSRVLETSV